MAFTLTTGLRGLEDVAQDAAGTLFTRTRVVNGSTTTGNITPFNASNFPVLATATQTKVANSGGVATYPGPAIGELADRVRAAVADVTALKALPAANLVDRQAVYVESKQTWYHFDSDGALANDNEWVVSPNDVAGNGRWFKQRSGTADRVERYDTLAALKAATVPTSGTLVQLTSYGIYRYDSASAVAADDKFTIQPTVGGGRYLIELVDKTKVTGSWIPRSDTDSTTIDNAFTNSGTLNYDTVALLRARTAHSAGDDAIVNKYGLYSYNAASADADDGILTIKPDDVAGGNPGRWEHVLKTSRGTNGGFAGITSAGRCTVAPQDSAVTTGMLAANAVTQVVQGTVTTSDISTTSSAWVNTGVTVTITPVGTEVYILINVPEIYCVNFKGYIGLNINGATYQVGSGGSGSGGAFYSCYVKKKITGLTPGVAYTATMYYRCTGNSININGSEAPYYLTAVEYKR